VHLLSRLATQHEIKNYAFNSSFENATISNSWIAYGLTASRDTTYIQFGTYCCKLVSTSGGQELDQIITFEGQDKIDIGDIFNLSIYIYQTASNSCIISISELNAGGSIIGTGSTATTGTDTGVYTRLDVSRTVMSGLCTRLLIKIISASAMTAYIDGVMLVRGIDPIGYNLVNSSDATTGTGNADNAATYLYDTVAVDTESVDLAHPYALVKKGESPWSHLKNISEALIPRQLGMTSDGVLKITTGYNETDPPVLGDITNVASVGTTLEVDATNSIKVTGVLINKETTKQLISSGTDIDGMIKNAGGQLQHPITSGSYLTLYGATEIEIPYKDANS
jgi:hypothetical protein